MMMLLLLSIIRAAFYESGKMLEATISKLSVATRSTGQHRKRPQASQAIANRLAQEEKERKKQRNASHIIIILSLILISSNWSEASIVILYDKDLDISICLFKLATSERK